MRIRRKTLRIHLRPRRIGCTVRIQFRSSLLAAKTFGAIGVVACENVAHL